MQDDFLIKISDSEAICRLLNEVFLLRREVNAMKKIIGDSPLFQNFEGDLAGLQNEQLEDLQLNRAFMQDHWEDLMKDLFDNGTDTEN